jgi:hypothetical protein
MKKLILKTISLVVIVTLMGFVKSPTIPNEEQQE